MCMCYHGGVAEYEELYITGTHRYILLTFTEMTLLEHLQNM